MSVTIDMALLATFVSVADGASFSGAARAAGTTTATVSRSIAKLEEAVGSRLFHRTTRRVSLTTAGKALHERVEGHVRGLVDVLKDLPERHAEPAGILKITAPYDLGSTVLGSVMTRFMTRFPKVQVHAEFTSRAVDLGAEGFDVALRGDSVRHRDSSLTARRLVPRAELGLFAAPSYLARRGAPRDVTSLEHDWLVAGLSAKMFDFPAKVVPKIVANDFLFLAIVAESGGGIATLPIFIAQPYVASGGLIRTVPAVRVHAGGLVMLYSARRPLAHKVVAFRDFMIDVVRREWAF